MTNQEWLLCGLAFTVLILALGGIWYFRFDRDQWLAEAHTWKRRYGAKK